MSNEKLIGDYLLARTSEGLGKRRLYKYNSMLNSLSQKLDKDFRKVTKEDLIKFFAKLETGQLKSKKGKSYTENTKRDYRIITKVFFRWLYPQEDEDIYPKIVRWIKTGENERLRQYIEEKDCLSEDEVYQMVDAAPFSRDKAIISLLFESGARISEIVGLKVGAIIFDDRGYFFESSLGKTGRHYVRVGKPMAVELMRRWIEEHPCRLGWRVNGKMLPINDSPLWACLSRANMGVREMGYGGIDKMVRLVGRKAGIEKRVSCHQFRHAHITDCFKKGYTDAEVETTMGYTAGTRMFKVYRHFKKNDIDKIIEKFNPKIEQESNVSWTKLCTFFTGRIMNAMQKDKDFARSVRPMLFDSFEHIGEKGMNEMVKTFMNNPKQREHLRKKLEMTEEEIEKEAMMMKERLKDG